MIKFDDENNEIVTDDEGHFSRSGKRESISKSMLELRA